MKKSACSEADLCTNCLILLKSISARTESFTPAGSSAYKGRGLWAPSDACGLCHMMNSSDFERFTITPDWVENFAGDSILIHYVNNMDSDGDDGTLSKLVIYSDRGLRMILAIWCDHVTPGISKDPPLPSDKCPESFALVRSWLQTCHEHHRQCLKSMSGFTVDEDHGPELPTRVLDVTKWTDGVVSLVESQKARAKFCALSYCWGERGHDMVTTRETVANHLSGINIDLLPQTFRDAIQLTSEIGIRYLWIDSLCIIQDDRDDWATQARDMANVYQNAYLVIAADGASHPGEGCFLREDIYPIAVKLPFYDESGQTTSSIWLSKEAETTDQGFPERGPLQRRGWALQETYLARRSVHFMPGGMTWKCRGAEMDERSGLGLQVEIENWAMLLESYSGRKLTYKKDRLFAVQGLANVFKKIKGVEYYMGVLKIDVEQQLMWISRRYASPSDSLEEVPSWSWASQGGAKIFFATGDLVEWPATTGLRTTMGADGRVRFTGYMGECTIGVYSSTPNDTKDSHLNAIYWLFDIYFDMNDFHIAHSLGATSQPIGFAAIDKPYSGRCFTAFLGETQWGRLDGLIKMWESPEEYPTLSNHPSRRLHWVLLLVPSSKKEDAFRRVGVGALWRDPEDGATTARQVAVNIV